MPINDVHTARVVLHHEPEWSGRQIDHRLASNGACCPHGTSFDLPVPGRDRTRARGALPLRDEQRRPTR